MVPLLGFRYYRWCMRAIADPGPAQVHGLLNVALTEFILTILHQREVVPMAQTRKSALRMRIADLVSRLFLAIGIATFLGAALCPQRLSSLRFASSSWGVRTVARPGDLENTVPGPVSSDKGHPNELFPANQDCAR